jgi:hypothetical protein
MLFLELPRVAFEAQRVKEQVLVDRGEEYKRGIQLYVRKFGKYPAKLEDLEETSNLRFIRRLYKDPMTEDGEWRLIHAGPNGEFYDSLVYGPKKTKEGEEQASTNTFITEGPAVGSTLITDPNLAGQQTPGAVRRRPSEGGTPLPGAGGEAGMADESGEEQEQAAEEHAGEEQAAEGQPVGVKPYQARNRNPGQVVAGQVGVQPYGVGQQPTGLTGQPGYAGANPVGMVPGTPYGSPGTPAQPYRGPQQYPGQPGQPQAPYSQQPGQPAVPYPVMQALTGQRTPNTPVAGGQQQGTAAQPSSGSSIGGYYGIGSGSSVGSSTPVQQAPSRGVPAGIASGAPNLGRANPGAAGQPSRFGQPATLPPGQAGMAPNPATNIIQNLLTSPRPGGLGGEQASPTARGETIGGGIAGVASKKEALGIKLYAERQNYNEWEFLYDPRNDRSRALAAGVMGGQATPGQGAPGQQGQSGLGQGTFGGQSSFGQSTFGGQGSFGQGASGGQSGFGTGFGNQPPGGAGQQQPPPSSFGRGR